MGSDKIRYLVFVCGRWRWRPTAAMRRHGFRLLSFGPALTAEDKAQAIRLNEDWDRVRTGAEPSLKRKVWPRGSVGDGYERARGIRAKERAAKGLALTTEQESRDDWPRAWKWLETACGDLDPRTISPEDLLALRTLVAQRVSESEAHRLIKVWRALWKKMAAMGYCAREADPSLTFSNGAPAPRQAVWTAAEVRLLVRGAWKTGYRGLAAVMAVSWDTQLSPVDVRRLTLAQMRREEAGALFLVARAKTGRPAIATLTRRSERILRAYLGGLGFDLLSDAPIFRTRGRAESHAEGGRPWAPRPYTKDKLATDFAAIREEVFGKAERRTLADFRRSGVVEATAGGAGAEQISAKMANTLSASNRLHRTYAPAETATVRQVDEARRAGRAKIANKDRTKVS